MHGRGGDEVAMGIHFVIVWTVVVVGQMLSGRCQNEVDLSCAVISQIKQ